MSMKNLKKLRSPKELAHAVANMGISLFTFSPFLSLIGLVALASYSIDKYDEHIKAEQLRPRVEHSQQLTNQMVENGMQICDPARQKKGAAAELNAAINRLMFIEPTKIGNKVDMQNMRNTTALNWAQANGIKICTDTQMDDKTAVMWFPKEKLLAVNGNYTLNLLSIHMRMAIHELMERGTYGHDFGTGERSALGLNRPLTEKFAISLQTRSPGTKMVISQSKMSRGQLAQKAPVRSGPKTGS